MLTFITTVRHPVNARSYDKIGELLSRTLTSVCRQTVPSFRVVVVHNNPPPPVSSHDVRVHFVPVDFPPPGAGKADQLGYTEIIRDKGTKTAVGISVARELGASHVMLMDADDLINREIAKIVAADHEAAGWYSPSGFIYTAGLQSIRPVSDGFHLKNGSTNIVRIDLAGVPAQIAASSSQQDILEVLGAHHVDQILGQHELWCPAAAAQGETLAPLPVPSAVWVIGTGENHSGNITSSRARVTIDHSVTEMFGLVRPTYWRHVLTTLEVVRKRVWRRLKSRRSRP